MDLLVCNAVARYYGLGKGRALKICGLTKFGDTASSISEVTVQALSFMPTHYDEQEYYYMKESHVKVWKAKVGRSIASIPK